VLATLERISSRNIEGGETRHRGCRFPAAPHRELKVWPCANLRLHPAQQNTVHIAVALQLDSATLSPGPTSTST